MDTWILVADRSHATIYRTAGQADGLHLATTLDNPEGHNEPVQVQAGEESDSQWRDRVTTQFASRINEILTQSLEEDRYGALVVAAPPQLLRELRDSRSTSVARTVKLELDQDLTHLPLEELELRLRDRL